MMRTTTDFAIAFRGLRLQAKAHGLDPNTEEMRRFLIHVAETSAEEHAEARMAMNLVHKQMSGK